MHYDYEVDATGLKCPLPILRCKKGLNEIKSDEVLKIIATDPGSKKDFDAFCRQTGHELLSLQDEDGVQTLEAKKILMHFVARQGMNFYLFKTKMASLLSLSRNVV